MRRTSSSRQPGSVLIRAALCVLLASSTAAFVIRPPSSSSPSSSSPLWKRQQQQPQSSSPITSTSTQLASAAASGPGAFEKDNGGWKDVNFLPQKTADVRPGSFRLPRLTDFWSTFPPASRLYKWARLGKAPVYEGLKHDDYIEACRQLGVPPDIDEGKLAAKVEALLVKYEKDRKKKIMIDWASDKIMEHRLFMQLEGEASKPVGEGVDLRLLDERYLEISPKDALDLMTSLDLSPGDVKGKPSALTKVVNNPLLRALQVGRLLRVVRYVGMAFGESLEGPNLKRMLWPGSVGLILALWFGNAVEIVPLKYFITIIANTGPIYNRGEAKLANRKERRPIKWNKLLLAFAFMAMSTGGAWAGGKAWCALKYPTGELPEGLFVPLVANVVTYVMSSCFFIRESTLAGGRAARDAEGEGGKGGKGGKGGGRRPA